MTKKTPKSKEPNLKGLGVGQLSILYRMIKEDLVIRVITDHDKRPTIELQSESGDDTFETIPLYVMRSLGNRKLFTCFGWMPALFITVDTYRLKPKVKELLLPIREQEDKRSVANTPNQGTERWQPKNKIKNNTY